METAVGPIEAGRRPADVRLHAERPGHGMPARIAGLLRIEREILDLGLGGASLDSVLARLTDLVERALAPASCVVSLFDTARGKSHIHASERLGPPPPAADRAGAP